MNILLLNPNMSEVMTSRMARVAASVAADGTTLVPINAARGLPYISSRAEAQIAGALVLEMIAERVDDIDAVIIAAFGDPGLRAARELFDLPVVGMAEAAILTACLLGNRFAFVTFTPNLNPWYMESVELAGLGARFAGVLAPATAFGSIDTVQEDMQATLESLIEQAAYEYQADVVIAAGAPLAGLAQKIADPSAVLIDPISAAVKQAEALVCLAPKGARAGSFARPPGKPSQGLDPALARWIARDRQNQ